MLVRITAGIGVGQIVDLVPAVAQARIAGGTAVAFEDEQMNLAETASIESGKRERENRKRKVTRSA